MVAVESPFSLGISEGPWERNTGCCTRACRCPLGSDRSGEQKQWGQVYQLSQNSPGGRAGKGCFRQNSKKELKVKGAKSKNH